MSALCAEALSVRRGVRDLLLGVELRVVPGEVLAVVGENGAGKSTLLRVLGGEYAPQSGRVCLDGVALSHWPADELARRRAVLPQSLDCVFDFTALEVVLLGRYPHTRGAPRPKDIAVARHCMRLTCTADLADASVLTLSGGERARVQLARVLAQLDVGSGDGSAGRVPPARYCLLDEPAASLDLAQQIGLFELLRSLTRHLPLGVVVSVHDLNIAARYADRLLVLRAGRVLAQGRPAECLHPELLATAFGVRTRIQDHPQGGLLVVALERVQEDTSS